MRQRIIKVCIADDHSEIAHGVDMILSKEHDIEVVGKVRRIEDLQKWFEEHQADVLLLDIRMPEPDDGWEACQFMAKNYPITKIITYSGYDRPVWIQRMLSSGAQGFLPKGSSAKIIAHAIREVRNGRVYMPDAIRQKLDAFSKQAKVAKRLTSREIDIIQELSLGKNKTMIADSLSMAESTVAVHLRNIRAKTEANSIVEIINMARKVGLVE